jgi:hypothetical protein
MKNFPLLAIFCLTLLLACKNEPATQSGSQEPSAVVAITPDQVRLICQPVAEPNQEADAPKHEVFLQLGDNKVKIADILNCQPLTADLYESNQVPSNALNAVYGWWAGAGDYIYVVEEGGNYVVKQGSQTEEQTDMSFNYKTVLTFTKEGKEVF